MICLGLDHPFIWWARPNGHWMISKALLYCIELSRKIPRIELNGRILAQIRDKRTNRFTIVCVRSSNSKPQQKKCVYSQIIRIFLLLLFSAVICTLCVLLLGPWWYHCFWPRTNTPIYNEMSCWYRMFSPVSIANTHFCKPVFTI